MAGKARPSLRAKTLKNVSLSNLSLTDKDCIKQVFERFEEAEKALEKQIPKKPKPYDTKFRQRGQKYGEYVTVEMAYDCPDCNCTVWEKDRSKYCGNCGQTLDWSDIK